MLRQAYLPGTQAQPTTTHIDKLFDQEEEEVEEQEEEVEQEEQVEQQQQEDMAVTQEEETPVPVKKPLRNPNVAQKSLPARPQYAIKSPRKQPSKAPKLAGPQRIEKGKSKKTKKTLSTNDRRWKQTLIGYYLDNNEKNMKKEVRKELISDKMKPIMEQITLSSTTNAIPKLNFSRLVRELVLEHASAGKGHDYRIRKDALDMLQTACETHMIEYLNRSYRIAHNANRETLYPQDMKVYGGIQAELVPQKI